MLGRARLRLGGENEIREHINEPHMNGLSHYFSLLHSELHIPPIFEQLPDTSSILQAQRYSLNRDCALEQGVLSYSSHETLPVPFQTLWLCSLFFDESGAVEIKKPR